MIRENHVKIRHGDLINSKYWLSGYDQETGKVRLQEHTCAFMNCRYGIEHWIDDIEL